MKKSLGGITKLKNGQFESWAHWIAPIKTFSDPHAAENYVREAHGMHPVVKTFLTPIALNVTGQRYTCEFSVDYNEFS